MFAQNCLKQKVIRPRGRRKSQAPVPNGSANVRGFSGNWIQKGSNDATLGPVVNLVEAQIENDENISVNKSKTEIKRIVWTTNGNKCIYVDFLVFDHALLERHELCVII